MTENEVKRILGRYRIARCKKLEAQRRISDKLEDIGTLRSMVLGRVSAGSGVNDTVERADTLISQYAEIAAECEQAERQAMDLLLLTKDEDELYQALFLRFIEGLSVEAASEKMYVSVRTLWNYSDRAIALICTRTK